MKARVFFLVVLFISIITLTLSATSIKTMIAFRIDDYGIDNEEFYPELFKLFSENNIPLIIGVVPYKKDGSGLTIRQIKILKKGIESTDLDIALHGSKHLDAIEDNIVSEFCGLSYDVQLDKIKDGKDYLEEVLNQQIKTFIPPWNAFDKTTLKVLSELNFETISADRKGCNAVENNTLNYIPATCYNLSKLKQAVEKIEQNTFKDPNIFVILLHAYNFVENDNFYKDYDYAAGLHGYTDLAEFQELIIWLKNQGNIEFKSISQLGENDELDFGFEKYEHNIIYRNWFHAPKFLLPQLEEYYLSINQARIYKLKSIIIPLLFNTLLFLLFSISSYTIHQKIKYTTFLKVSDIIFILITMMALAYIVRDGTIGIKGSYLIVAATGSITGYIIKIINVKKVGCNVQK